MFLPFGEKLGKKEKKRVAKHKQNDYDIVHSQESLSLDSADMGFYLFICTIVERIIVYLGNYGWHNNMNIFEHEWCDKGTWIFFFFWEHQIWFH